MDLRVPIEGPANPFGYSSGYGRGGDPSYMSWPKADEVAAFLVWEVPANWLSTLSIEDVYWAQKAALEAVVYAMESAQELEEHGELDQRVTFDAAGWPFTGLRMDDGKEVDLHFYGTWDGEAEDEYDHFLIIEYHAMYRDSGDAAGDPQAVFMKREAALSKSQLQKVKKMLRVYEVYMEKVRKDLEKVAQEAVTNLCEETFDTMKYFLESSIKPLGEHFGDEVASALSGGDHETV